MQDYFDLNCKLYLVLNNSDFCQGLVYIQYIKHMVKLYHEQRHLLGNF